jgi:hypothetical protein
MSGRPRLHGVRWRVRVGEKEVEIVSRTGTAMIYLRRALCRTVIATTSPRRGVDGQTYQAGCCDRKVRETQKKS